MTRKLPSCFFTRGATEINDARTSHMLSLGLPMEGKTVLEVGAGVGRHTPALLGAGCLVTSTDAREDNVAVIRDTHPIWSVYVWDVEEANPPFLGSYDYCYCYGLLYHLEFPEVALWHLSELCQTILLETIVDPGKGSIISTVAEPSIDADQSISGLGCRPTRLWVMDILNTFWGYAYTTLTQPKHPDFPTDWAHLGRTRHKRAVFVGSKDEIDNPNLTRELPERHKPW